MYLHIICVADSICHDTSYSTCCHVDPKKAVAKYENGVLKVTVPYLEPLDNLVTVKIE